MFGGTGNDTYVVDNAGDVVNETGGDGTDTVQSSVSFSLADPVHAIGGIENLTLTGTAAINATGNALDNVLIGNSGNNVLIGGAGADTLDGGGGTDTASYAASCLGRNGEPGDGDRERGRRARRHAHQYREPDGLELRRHAGGQLPAITCWWEGSAPTRCPMPMPRRAPMGLGSRSTSPLPRHRTRSRRAPTR